MDWCWFLTNITDNSTMFDMILHILLSCIYFVITKQNQLFPKYITLIFYVSASVWCENENYILFKNIWSVWTWLPFNIHTRYNFSYCMLAVFVIVFHARNDFLRIWYFLFIKEAEYYYLYLFSHQIFQYQIESHYVIASL